jgi:hypothetical protein
MEDRTRKPTSAQIDYARYLLNELGYDEQEYDIEGMTRLALANLIDDLRKELNG